jgi:hypothetical protein
MTLTVSQAPVELQRILMISPPDFLHFQSPFFTIDGSGYLYGEGGTVRTSMFLQGGALIESFTLFYDDTNDSKDLSASLWNYSGFGDNEFAAQLALVSSDGNFGKGSVTIKVGLTVNNDLHLAGGTYEVRVNFGTPGANQDPTLRFRAIEIRWHPQVKAPAGARTFADVETTDPFYKAIEALAASGITSGCGNGNFCPNAVVTRGQLAKFLARGLGLYWP